VVFLHFLVLLGLKIEMRCMVEIPILIDAPFQHDTVPMRIEPQHITIGLKGTHYPGIQFFTSSSGIVFCEDDGYKSRHL
jgi:hypothetical protein